MGNQLIQQAYAHSLAWRSGASLRLNPLLLSPGWAALRRVTYRSCNPLLAADFSETLPWQSQWLHLLRFYLARHRGLALHDGITDDQALTFLNAAKPSGWLPLLGYVQRAQAFGPASDGFWIRVAELLHNQYRLKPYPSDQVALHVRFGDYLLPQNQLLFAPLVIRQQLEAALVWREQLGGRDSLQVVTDDPLTFSRRCPEIYRGDVYLSTSSNALDDFLTLVRHRRIVASNSTFSLCAGKLAASLWGDVGTTMLPQRWYRDSSRDVLQQQEWRQLQFVVDFW